MAEATLPRSRQRVLVDVTQLEGLLWPAGWLSSSKQDSTTLQRPGQSCRAWFSRHQVRASGAQAHLTPTARSPSPRSRANAPPAHALSAQVADTHPRDWSRSRLLQSAALSLFASHGLPARPRQPGCVPAPAPLTARTRARALAQMRGISSAVRRAATRAAHRALSACRLPPLSPRAARACAHLTQPALIRCRCVPVRAGCVRR